MAKHDKAFIEKLKSLTFGTGAKAVKAKVKCVCGQEHSATLVGPFVVPFSALPKSIQDGIKARSPKPKANDETAFSA